MNCGNLFPSISTLSSQLQPPPKEAAAAPVETKRKVVALYDYTKVEEDDLTLVKV